MIDGRLAPERAITAERHLDDCRACREAFAAASAQDEALDLALEHDPGDAYFESFSDRVQMKIGEAGKRPAMAGSFLDILRDWFSVPRNLATAGAIGAVVIGVGTALIVTRQTNQDVMKNERLAARMEQREGAAAPPPTELNARETQAERQQKLLDQTAEPGATLGLSEEAARQSREFRAKDRDASGSQAEVAPQRAQQVRKNALGDDERVAASAPSPSVTRNESGSGVTPPAADNVKAALRAQPMSKTTSRDFAYEAAGARLCGEVRDPAGRPLRFATVSLLGRSTGDQTDDHGRFCLPVTPGRDSLVVQLVGFAPLRTGVSLTSSPTQEIRLTMEPIRTLATSTRGMSSEVQAGKPAALQTPAEPGLLRSASEMTLTALPDSLRPIGELAQRLSTVAARSKDVRQHEAAAAQWERLLVGVSGTSLEIATRGRIAEQRYQAWEASPDPRRAQAAREALTAYLVRAPIGPERNRATLWLDNVAK